MIPSYIELNLVEYSPSFSLRFLWSIMTTFPDFPLDIDTIALNRPVTVPGGSQPDFSATTLNVMAHIFPVFMLVSGTGLVERERTMKSTPLNLTSSTRNPAKMSDWEIQQMAL